MPADPATPAGVLAGSSGSRPLARLLRPRAIAAVGGDIAAEVVRQCERLGFDGEIWPVHPVRQAVEGRPVFRTIGDLPSPPDAAFVAVNRQVTVTTVADLALHGAGGAVCYASGFREADDGGAHETALVAAAGEMPIVGPNCYGLLNFLDRVALWPDQHGGRPLAPCERGVAVIAQSSNIAVSLTMQRRGLPIAYLATVGNQAQLGVSALAAAFVEDERVTALGLYIEAFDSVAGFESLARKARERRVPVVLMKAGRSDRGRAATLSHTASIAGSDAGAAAFLRRLGFARVTGIPELLEALKLLHVHGPLGGSRVGVLCCSGGEAGVVADAVGDTALTLPSLAPEHAADVADTVHPLVTVANPLDYHTFSWGDEAALTRTFTTFVEGHFDLAAVVLDYPRADRCVADDWQVTQTAFERAVTATGTPGAVVATLPENLPERTAAELIDCGVAPLVGVREALTAVECAAEVGAGWRGPVAAPLVRGAIVAGEPVLLDEATAKARLAAAGVSVPDGRTAASADEAVAAAESIGGTVAVKALGVAHKTDHGAIVLGVRGADEVRAAVLAVTAAVHGTTGPPRLLIERYVADTVVELIVGIQRDPILGAMLTIGTGGTLVELIADSVTMLLPVTADEVQAAMHALRCAPILAGYRGGAPADTGAAVDAILRIAQYGVDNFGRLEELDVNPLGVRARGRGALALDVLIRERRTG